MKHLTKFLMGGAFLILLSNVAYADTLLEIKQRPIDFPISLEDAIADHGVSPASEEIRVPEAELRFDFAGCFGFQPQVETNPGSSNFSMVTWCEQGGWTGPARATVSKIAPDGTILAETSVQDDGEDPFGHSDGWGIAAFDDGGVVVAGGSRFGLPPPLDLVDRELLGIRFYQFDSALGELQDTTDLVSGVEPDLAAGNDDRDFSPIGEDLMRPRITTLDQGGGAQQRAVVSFAHCSAALQVANGLVDPGPESNPGCKIYFRIWNQDGTPASATTLAFDINQEDDLGKWTASYARHDIGPRFGGGFMMATAGQTISLDTDPAPIYLYDADGNLERKISVADPDLLARGAVAQSIAEAEVTTSRNGISAYFHSIRPDWNDDPDIEDRIQNGVISFFHENGGDPQILRSTINATGQKTLSPIREGDMDISPDGTFAVTTTRGEYTDPDTGDPLGPDNQNDMLTIRYIASDGTYLTQGFIPYDEDKYPGSQRDPALAINDTHLLIAYLSDAPDDTNTAGGLNAFRIFNNPVIASLLPADVNQDARLDISDGTKLLNFLFSGDELPGCFVVDPEAPIAELTESGAKILDVNGDGGANLADAVSILNWLFVANAPPPKLGTTCAPVQGDCSDNCSF